MGRDTLKCEHEWEDNWEDNVLYGPINYPRCSKCKKDKEWEPSPIALGVYR